MIMENWEWRKSNFVRYKNGMLPMKTTNAQLAWEQRIENEAYFILGTT